MQEDVMNICFQILASMGSARSSYIEAVQEAKEGNFERAEELIKAGDEAYREGHGIHGDLISREAAGEKISAGLLLIHCEDILMSAETIKIMAEELIWVHKKLLAKAD